MKKMDKKFEQILKIMASCVPSYKYGLWFPELQLMKVDEDMKAMFVSTDDPFKGAYIMRTYGDNLDRAAEMVFGAGYKVYVTYDKDRRKEDDFLSVRDNEFTLTTNGITDKYSVRMLFITNTDVEDDELNDMILRMQDRAKREKALNAGQYLSEK